MALKSFLKDLLILLQRHYTAPQLPMFKRLRNGFVIFALGLICIFVANVRLSPSLQQEVVVLIGLSLCGIGFIVAMLAYIRIVISRIVSFFSDK